MYLLTHSQFFAVKVGVTTSKSRTNRVDQHLKFGWQLVEQWPLAVGNDARDVEQAMLSWWRKDLGACAAVAKTDMPQGGWSETASLLWVDVAETAERIQAEVDRLLS